MKHTLTLTALTLALAAGCASNSPAPAAAASAGKAALLTPARSNEGLTFATSSIAGEHKAGEPIPVTVRFTNPVGYPVQFSPHINVIVRGNKEESDWRVDLPLDRPIKIMNGAAFEWTLDLARAIKLTRPGAYDVTIGHENSVSGDPANWKGSIYTQPQHVVIR
jgi:hypothetical protein